MFSGLDTEAYDRTYGDIELIQRIASYFAPHRKRVVGVVFFVSLVSLAAAGQPLIISRGVGALEGQPSMLFILLLFIFMTIFAVGVWLANWIRRRLTIRLLAVKCL